VKRRMKARQRATVSLTVSLPGPPFVVSQFDFAHFAHHVTADPHVGGGQRRVDSLTTYLAYTTVYIGRLSWIVFESNVRILSFYKSN